MKIHSLHFGKSSNFGDVIILMHWSKTFSVKVAFLSTSPLLVFPGQSTSPPLVFSRSLHPRHATRKKGLNGGLKDERKGWRAK